MAKVRIEKNKNFTIMSNYHFKDKRLSLKTIGLLSLMLSLPDNWDYSINGLIAIVKDGKDAVRSALDELKKYGYLEINRLMPNETTSKKIEYEYIIYEMPKDMYENLESD